MSHTWQLKEMREEEKRKRRKETGMKKKEGILKMPASIEDYILYLFKPKA
jgi:hypothetical protein